MSREIKIVDVNFLLMLPIQEVVHRRKNQMNTHKFKSRLIKIFVLDTEPDFLLLLLLALVLLLLFLLFVSVSYIFSFEENR